MTTGSRSLRCIEWIWDPEPADETYAAEYAFLLRDGVDIKAVHDRHVEGLFARATWVEILSGAGYRVDLVDRPFDDTTTDQIFHLPPALAGRSRQLVDDDDRLAAQQDVDPTRGVGLICVHRRCRRSRSSAASRRSPDPRRSTSRPWWRCSSRDPSRCRR